MRYVCILCILVLGGVLLGCGDPSPSARTVSAAAEPPRRVVSLAPSITEVLFALGQGDRVVGVTDHCRYPAEAAEKPRVGGFLDANAERVVALEPDLVLYPPNSGDLGEQLRNAGIRCELVSQFTIDEVFQSIARIGELCGTSAEAQGLTAELQERLARVAERTHGKSRPRVLVCVGRDYSRPVLDAVYVAGRGSFYGELVERAGGRNACEVGGFAYPTLSAEGLMEVNPDVILEVPPAETSSRLDPEFLRKAWETLPDLEAVKHGRIYYLDGDYVGIPGPRLVRIVEDMAARIHPEAGR